jgi:hypothetical protein
MILGKYQELKSKPARASRFSVKQKKGAGFYGKAQEGKSHNGGLGLNL